MRSLLALFVGTALTGCYNPDLGPNPFLCAASGKLCPDGYVCGTRNNVKVCLPENTGVKADARLLTDAELEPSKNGPPYIDGSVVKSSKGCRDEQSEPNNSSATATVIARAGSLPGWEICYPGDVDTYKIALEVGQGLTANVMFTNSNGDLDVALLDPRGEVVDMSRTLKDTETVKVAKAAIKGDYYLGVYGFGPAVNVYDMDITIITAQ